MQDAQLRDTIQARTIELIGHFVPLKSHGKQYVGPCPFHDDTRPSLSVNPSKGVFHCFRCGAAGDSLAFVMRKTGLRFPEALDEATRLLVLPPPARPQEAATTPLATAAECATRLFSPWLWEATGASGRRYLQTRGIAEATAKQFRLGYHPDHPTALLRVGGTGSDNGTGRGVGTRDAERPPLGKRVPWPPDFSDYRWAWAGARLWRTRVDGPWAQIPQLARFSPLPQKQLLYGLAQARESVQRRGEALVVEGYLDVLRLHQAGLTATVSPLSTTLSAAQLTVLRPFVKQVVLVFDGDPAGQTAMTRVFLPAEESDLPVRVVTLPPTHDPDSYVRDHGGAAFDELVTQAVPLNTYVLQQLVSNRTTIDGIDREGGRQNVRG